MIPQVTSDSSAGMCEKSAGRSSGNAYPMFFSGMVMVEPSRQSPHISRVAFPSSIFVVPSVICPGMVLLLLSSNCASEHVQPLVKSKSRCSKHS